jgi:hypothetical protein
MPVYDTKLFSYYSILLGSTRLRSWLRHYATSRKFAVSSLVEVDFLIYLILLGAL